MPSLASTSALNCNSSCHRAPQLVPNEIGPSWRFREAREIHPSVAKRRSFAALQSRRRFIDFKPLRERLGQTCS
jgi:hypothetical protein